MADSTAVQRPPRPRVAGRVPSGPRPAPNASNVQGASRSTSKSSISTLLSGLRSGGDHPHTLSGSSLDAGKLSLDALIDAEHDFTTSPEGSPRASTISLSLAGQTTPGVYSQPGSEADPGRSATEVRSNTSPFPILRPGTPTSPVSRSSTPTASSPISVKPKPKPSRLNTVNLLSPTPVSPTKPISPSLKHWQQVRHHVLSSPAVEPGPAAAIRQGKKLGLVSKAAERFGFRHAAESVMGFDDEKRSSVQTVGTYSGTLSREEQEEIARERRMFARDIRNCVEACSLEESRRRYARLGEQGIPVSDTDSHVKGAVAGSLHGSSHHHVPRYDFNPQFSSFVPLLTELHRHLPAARAKKPWSRTCPHHASILAELGVSFLPDTASSDGERQQALEIFGVLVKNWAPENEEEEIDRWVWLCRALRLQDRQVRNRGFSMLSSLLHRDPSFPQGHQSPHSAEAFITLGVALIELLQAVESSAYVEEHLHRLNTFLAELRDGVLISVNPASLDVLLGSANSNVTTGIEYELFWISAVTALRSNQSTAMWLLDPANTVLDRFSPPPIIHAVHPTVIGLRVRASTILLTSLAHISSTAAEATIPSTVWRVAEDSVLRDMDMLPVDEPLRRALSNLLITLELRTCSPLVAAESSNPPDPFKVLDIEGPTPPDCRQLLITLFSEPKWASSITAACKLAISASTMRQTTCLLQIFLGDAKLATLGKYCIEDLWTRLANVSDTDAFVVEFLRWLSRTSPQLLYKPLFALSAANQPSTLRSAYTVVRRLAQLLGPTQFWTYADPQMIVIVLMAASAPKPRKGKGREGEAVIHKIKLGRYAVLLELCAALSQADVSASTASRLRTFCDSLEQRVGPLLEAEEKDGRLPDLYRALWCELFSEIRAKTLSTRKSVWQRMILSWYPQGLCADDKTESEVVAILRAVVHDEASPGNESQQLITPTSPLTEAQIRLLALQLPISLSRSIVSVQASLSTEDWQALLPVVWRRLDDHSPVTPYSIFLLMKCSELVPEQTRVLLLSDLLSPDPTIRRLSLAKLSGIYSWRYQIMSQRVISDGRRPIFHFANRTLEFVMTEIGTPQWVTPVDQQDAALQRFGSSLPVELRQRLMELGWSQDASENGRSDVERLPLTRTASIMTPVGSAGDGRSPSPLRSLARTSSTGSATSTRIRRRRPMFGPTFANLVNEQASIMTQETSASVAQLSYEIVQTMQREDAAMLVRTFSDGMGDFQHALARLNAMFTSLTPAFAYAALNAITGYLRNILRNTPDFPLYSTALVTISRLAPHVSEISLRDVRKSKAEAILLPASIHEEEGGFQTHRPWHESANDIQTAQLLILLQILKVSPREVYLFKKMLSNLQIQAFADSVDLCRAWLLLINQLFTTVNRNYADRSELRHFLVNIGFILRRHQRDVLVVAHAMRALMLCSAKFRRMFASVGFAAVMVPVYETYSGGNQAVRDCIEYTMRSFYRIHQETVIYQTCISIADSEYEAAAVYSLLSCLSVPNSPNAGLATGIRGLNDQEELSAVVQMLSGPEVGLSELTLGQAAKRADKVAAVSLEVDVFPRGNIIRLLVTIIAANPATKRAASFLRLFGSIMPHVTDLPSRDLIRDAVEALGNVIGKGKVGDEGAVLAFHSGDENAKPDWTRARAEYVKLVEAYASSGGQLSPTATKRVLDMTLDLLTKDADTVGPATAGIIRELAKTRLANTRPVAFLRDIAGLFRAFLAIVDFSGLLDSITSLIRRTNHGLDTETSEVIISGYVEPSIRLLASAAEDNMAFIVPLRRSAVDLLSAAVFLKGDAFAVVEQQRVTASLLASVIMPLSMMLEQPQTTSPDSIYEGIWVRLLRLVIPHARAKSSIIADSRTAAATRLLSMQVVKIILIRAPAAISVVRGLWPYIASHIIRTIDDANGRFAEPSLIRPPPRAVDWLAWTFFELLALHPLPLMIHLRHRIQVALGQMHDADTRSRASSPGEDARPRIPSSPKMGGRARLHSRTPSAVHNLRMPSMSATSPAGLTVADEGRLTPDMAGSATGSGRSVSHARIPSQHLTPILGHARMPSASRPSFADLSARRVSRPAFDTFSPRPDRSPSTAGPVATPSGVGLNLNYRFPSSAPAGIRPESGRGGAIVHLLSQPDMKPKLPGMGMQAKTDPGVESLHMIIRTDEMIVEARRSVRRVMLVFGYPVEMDENEEPLKTWNAHDALHAIAEQTRCLIEEEFRDVFTPAVDTGLRARHAPRKSGASAMGSVFSDKHEESLVSPIEGYDVDRAVMDYEERQLPTLSVSPAVD